MGFNYPPQTGAKQCCPRRVGDFFSGPPLLFQGFDNGMKRSVNVMLVAEQRDSAVFGFRRRLDQRGVNPLKGLLDTVEPEVKLAVFG